MSNYDELEERVMTLERIVNQLIKDVHPEMDAKPKILPELPKGSLRFTADGKLVRE